MAEEDYSPGSPHSLKNKLRSSLCLSYCFPHLLHHRVKPRIVRSASLHKSRSNDFPHLKDKCCSFIARIGRHRRHHHNRRHSADFHYDALSYALNFEDDATDDRSDEDLRNFSARLPPSPPPVASQKSAPNTSATVEIAALS